MSPIRRLFALSLPLAALSACGGDGPSDPGTGSVEVTTVSTGGDLDDALSVAVDGAGSAAIAANATETLAEVASGTRTVSLTAVRANCAVEGENPRSVSVTAGETVAVEFELTCRDALIGRIAFYSDREDFFQVWSSNQDGSDPVRLSVGDVDGMFGTATAPAISPDGTQVLHGMLLGGSMFGEIILRNADGSDPVNLTNNAAGDREPAWSPDGSRIAFESGRNGDDEIFVMNADGSGAVNISDSPDSDESSPNWSPDGSQIVFTSDRDANLEIYIMNADGSGQTNLTDDPDVDWNGSWSPDGTRIAFQTDRVGNYDIFLMDADGSNPVNITTNAALDLNPAWSPDGERIAFSSNRNGDTEVFAVNPDGSGVTNLTNTPESNETPGNQPWGLDP